MDSPKVNLQKLRKNNKKIMGCFPLYPPLEIFHAMDIVPITLWGLKDVIRTLGKSDQHVQNYACSIARRATEFILSENGQILDGIFMYNACDTLRNLPEIISNGLRDAGRPLPIFQMHIPMVPAEQTDTGDYLQKEISSLIQQLEDAFNMPFSLDRFQDSTERYKKVRYLCLQLEELVALGNITFRNFVTKISTSSFFSPEDQLQFLTKEVEYYRKVEPKTANHSTPRLPIMISGILPPPLSVIQAMEEAGLSIVCNDIASLGRSYGYSPNPTSNTGQYFVDLYGNHIPCPTLLYSADGRLEYLRSMIKAKGVKGVVFIGEKFCEYEYFEFPYLEKVLKGDGIPSVLIEISVDDEDNIAALKNRIDAFAEIFG